MNIETEFREGHIARLTVRIDEKETQKAKQKAANRLSKQVRIPGFRPGKAPYKIIARRLGEEAILEEAVESLGNDTYKKVLDESDVKPAGPGSFVEYREEDRQLIMVFDVPRSPEVDLKGYRDLRLPLEIKEVTDDNVEKAVVTLQDNLAVLETVEREAQIGDQLTLQLNITWWHDEDHDEEEDGDDDKDDENGEDDKDKDDIEDSDGDETDEDDIEDSDDDEADENDEDDETDDDDDDDDDDEHGHAHPHTLIDKEETAVLIRDANDDGDVLPGFSAHLIGLKAGDDRFFTLDVPEDYEDEEIAGQQVEVTLTVHKVQNRILPAINDFMAESATNGEVNTLEALRTKIREDLEEASKTRAENELLDEALKTIIEQSEILYPDVLVQVYIDAHLKNFDKMLEERMGIKMDDYKRITGKTDAEVREDVRETATEQLVRDLVLEELMQKEYLRDVSEKAIDRELDKMVEQFGEQAQLYRDMLSSPEQRGSIEERVVNQRFRKRILDILQGKEPPVGLDEEDKEVEEAAAATEAETEEDTESDDTDVAEAESEAAPDSTDA